MKYESIVFLLVAIALSVVYEGCTSVSDVSKQTPYSEMIGKKFVLLQDCYVYQTKETGTNLFVGNAAVGHFLPVEVSSAFINKKIGKDVLIVGILYDGTIFKTVRCEKQQSPEDMFLHYKAQFEKSSFNGPTLDVSDLTDMTKNPPVFRDGLAKPLER
jgi:hypothetical protein